MSRWIGVCFLVLVVMSSATRPLVAAQVPEILLPMLETKSAIALELSKPIAKCVSRKDTAHPAFSGCIDWHSSVHGTWALIAYMRATGDRRYEELVERTLSPSKIARERKYIRDHKHFEMPYGRAWFLRLAIDHKLFTGSDRLAELARGILDSMVKFYHRSPPSPFSGSYDSDSWALINMFDYSKLAGDSKTQNFVAAIVRDRFVLQPGNCDYRREAGEFMAICTNWAWLVSKVMEREKFVVWAERFFERNGLPKPVRSPSTWHHYGLNFSRAWGLWEIYSQTNSYDFLQAYIDHFKATYGEPKSWRGSYRGVAHWVPQFGMFAIQPHFGRNGR